MCEAHTKHRRHFKRTGKMGSKSSTAQLDRGCLLSFTVTEVMLRFGGVSIVGVAAAIFRYLLGIFIHSQCDVSLLRRSTTHHAKDICSMNLEQVEGN